MNVRNQQCRYILAMDPSGNFNEGKGTTGWAILNAKTKQIVELGDIDAGIYLTQGEYWQAHIQLIKDSARHYPDLHLVVEDYFLYSGQASSQINSRMETPKLIGIIEYYCWDSGTPLLLQTANSVKHRWNDYILTQKGYFVAKEHGSSYRHYINGELIHNHIKDAIRHGVHYATFHANK